MKRKVEGRASKESFFPFFYFLYEEENVWGMKIVSPRGELQYPLLKMQKRQHIAQALFYVIMFLPKRFCISVSQLHIQ